MQKKKKNKLFIFLIICFVLMPFLFTKGCNYMESLNHVENSVSEPISSISGQIQPSAYSHIHERAHNAQVHSIRKANWTGTAVPNSGYIENVYINKNLDTDNVISLLDTISTDSNGTYMVTFYNTDNGGNGIIINDVGKTHPELGVNGYVILLGSELIFISSQTIQEAIKQYMPDLFSDFIGWNPNTSDVIEINSYSVTAIQFGLENDKLSSLFSITPFIDSSNELSIGNLFAQLANAILLFGVAIVELFLALEPIFWNDGPTLIFILLIAGVAFALASWGLELLISLVGGFRKKRKKKK